jgi:thioredoxin 1
MSQSFHDIIQSSTPVLVDFHAEWCGPCKAMNPIIKDVARQLQGKLRIIKVDIDQAEMAARQYGVSSVPTFMIFKEGQIKWRHSGMIDKASLIKVIEDNC